MTQEKLGNDRQMRVYVYEGLTVDVTVTDEPERRNPMITLAATIIVLIFTVWIGLWMLAGAAHVFNVIVDSFSYKGAK